MARYHASIDSERDRDAVFAYLSDFTTTREWDPGVISLVARFLGRDNQLTYKVVEFEPPHAVTFLGENETVVSRDRITFDVAGGGTRVTYDAELTLKGLSRLADPLLALAFKRVGDRGLAGMRQALRSSPRLA
jgi:hypothetical protein